MTTPNPPTPQRPVKKELSELTADPSAEAMADHSNPPADPAVTRNTSDPGDETQRNFRYQHAYGVILLASAKRGLRAYVAIWCEHHEDLLAQRSDGCYDGYQIKTSRPENGTWRMLDEEIVKSIGRFIDLVREFGAKIGGLFFVTNTEFDDVSDAHKDEKRRARRPKAFLTHIRACKTCAEISPLYLETFREIQGQCGCQPDELLAVLQKMDLILGPSRDSFASVLAHEHLGSIDECANLSPTDLDAWRDHLIAVVCAASSLAITDPIRHLRQLINSIEIDPALDAKRLDVATVMAYSGKSASAFRFPGPPLLQLGAPEKPHVLEAKLQMGGIGDQIEYMRSRERAAEVHLMEDALRDADGFPAILRHLEEIVLGECSEAHLRARTNGATYGAEMLIDIQERLRRIARDEPTKVFNKQYECLMGLVGLLTTDTRVWFSSRFPVQESAA